MANGALSIPITADASKFLQTLATVKSDIKALKKELETASGTRIAEINLKINGLEYQKNAFAELGKYAEGTYGRLLQQLDYLNAYKLTLQVDSQEFADTVAKLKEVNTLIDTANGKQIKIKTELEPPPTGSIKAIQNDIKKYTALRDIQVDPGDIEAFNAVIKRLEDRVQNLKNAGIQLPTPEIDDAPIANSIEGIRKQIRDLNKQKGRIDLDDQGEIARINTQIDELEAKISKADKLGFDSKGKIAQNAGKARQAITSLSLVAQDLPFGFIAIQNNLPAVFETFGQLKNQSGGLKGALKELGGQLLGPGGAFLAFSAVTAAVTYAVKEYGSLGNAIDALFGKLDPLYKVVNRTNEAISKFKKDFLSTGEAIAQATGSTESQIIKMKALSDVVLDTTKSENERKYALQEMKSIDEARFGRYDVEKGKLEGLTDSVNAYTRSVVANSVAQKLSDRTADALIVRNAALNLFTEQEKRIESLKKQYPDVENGLRRYIAAQKVAATTKGVLALPEAGVSEFINATAKLDEYKDSLNELNKIYIDSKKEASEATDEAVKLGAAFADIKGDTKTKKIDFKFDLKLSDDYKDFINFNAFDKALDRLKQYADIVLDVNRTEKERSAALKILNKESKEVLGISTNLFGQFKLGVTPLAKISQAIDQYGFTLQDLIIKEKRVFEERKKGSNINTAFYKSVAAGLSGASIRGFIDSTEIVVDKFNELKFRARELPKQFLESFREFKGAFPTIDQFKEKLNEILRFEFEKTGKINEGLFSKIIEDEFSKIEKVVSEFEGFKKLQKEFEGVTGTISDVFLTPFSELFTDVFDNGKEAFAEFSKSVLANIKQLAAKIIATGIINLLANILLPGGGKAASILGKNTTGAGGGILGAFGAAFKSVFGIKQESNPNFAGVQGGGMQLAGEVVFRQRGSDLVGVINRTNGTINRVG